MVMTLNEFHSRWPLAALDRRRWRIRACVFDACAPCVARGVGGCGQAPKLIFSGTLIGVHSRVQTLDALEVRLRLEQAA